MYNLMDSGGAVRGVRASSFLTLESNKSMCQKLDQMLSTTIGELATSQRSSFLYRVTITRKSLLSSLLPDLL